MPVPPQIDATSRATRVTLYNPDGTVLSTLTQEPGNIARLLDNELNQTAPLLTLILRELRIQNHLLIELANGSSRIDLDAEYRNDPYFTEWSASRTA